MEQTAIFSATLGLFPPWQVTSATFSKDSNRLDIQVEFLHTTGHDCPFCGGRGTCRPAGTVQETWFHDDFFRYATYLQARVPLLACRCGRKLHPERPWSRAGSRFCRLPSPQ